MDKKENPGCYKCVHLWTDEMLDKKDMDRFRCGNINNSFKCPIYGTSTSLCSEANANLDCPHFEQK